MDYQSLTNSIAIPCAILSVEKMPEGLCGDIRFVCVNQPMREVLGAAYRDGILYQDILPKNVKFEDFCFHSAVRGQRGHVYVEVPWLGDWADEYATPMLSEDERFGYCQLTVEFTGESDTRRMSAVSRNTAEAAINASITLMRADDFKQGVQKVLNDTMVMSGAHHSRLFMLDSRNRSVSIYCEAADPSGDHKKNDALRYDLIRTWEKCIGNANALLLSNDRDFAELEKENPDWVANMRQFGVKSLVLIPLRRKNEVFGYVDFVDFDTEKIAEVKELVELIAIFLGTEISNHLLMMKLEEMSTTDPLTGLRNRNAMLRKMDYMGDECFGVINLDLNGLKAVNDSQGHDAGDELLIMAAEALTKVFYQNDAYRTGGDEFIILTPGISRESFYSKLERFRLSMSKNGELSFAMGAFWSDGSVELTTAFRKADEAMYADKRDYYRRNPELRR